MKFIHLADVHLDCIPEVGTSFGELRKKEIWDAFFDVIEECKREEIDLLLIPGDLFAGQPSLESLIKVSKVFGEIPRIKVVLIAGNHDCLLLDSHYYDIKFPPNVFFLMNSYLDSVYIEDLNTQVYGLSYERKEISETRYDVAKPDNLKHINILLAHGNIHGNDKSIPINISILENANFDYVALGHLHTRTNISDRIAYTGGFEPFERKETGDKGYIKGEILKIENESSIKWEFVPHAKRKYKHFEIDVSQYSSDDLLLKGILTYIEANGTQNMYILRMKGKKDICHNYTFESIKHYIHENCGIIVEIEDMTI